MIKLTFEFSTAHQLAQFSESVAETYHRVVQDAYRRVPQAGAPVAPVAPSVSEDQPEPAAKKPRGRPSTKSAAAPQTPDVAAVAVVETAAGTVAPQDQAIATPVPTAEEVLAVQQKLYAKKGAETCIQLLQRHGVFRLSAVTPDQRARYIADAHDILDGKDIAAAA
jgi:hypothetical protein